MRAMKSLLTWVLVAVCGVATSAHAGDFAEVLGVRIGDRVGVLGQKVAGLEPDVCAKHERSWYQANGWSCEGYAKSRVMVGAVELKARFRMIEPQFSVGNVTLTGEVTGSAAGDKSEALVSSCIALKREMDGVFGRGSVANASNTPGAVKYVVFYEVAGTKESATLLCQQDESTGRAEMAVSIEAASNERGTRVGGQRGI